jgi:hypothetical protein
MRWFLSAVLLLSAVPAALACINDRESTSHEREFKSSYLQQVPPAPPASEEPPSSTTDQLKIASVSGLGVALLVGAVVVGLGRFPRRR